MIYTCNPGKVSIYINTKKKTTAQIKAETGCTALINGGLFDMSTFSPVCHLKADGKVPSPQFRSLCTRELSKYD